MEDLGNQYDGVIASEILEHVTDAKQFMSSCCQLVKVTQGGHGTGKTGNLVPTFSRQGKHREFCCNTGKIFETQGKYFDCIYHCKKHVSLHIFSIFFSLASFGILSSFR